MCFILPRMGAGVFVSDNRLQFSRSLAEVLRNQGCRVCLSAHEAARGDVPVRDGLVYWNRASPFSLRGILLQIENLGIVLETAVFVFDAQSYVDLYPGDDFSSIDRISVDLIVANMALVHMLTAHFVSQARGKLLFVHRETSAHCASAMVSVASAAFVRMAEECVLGLARKDAPRMQTLLIRLDGVDDDSYTQWIATDRKSVV